MSQAWNSTPQGDLCPPRPCPPCAHWQSQESILAGKVLGGQSRGPFSGSSNACSKVPDLGGVVGTGRWNRVSQPSWGVCHGHPPAWSPVILMLTLGGTLNVLGTQEQRDGH